MQSQSFSRSPSSSPPLVAIDSSPPSSPSHTTIYTPPASPGAVDPFAGSTKSNKRPRIYHLHGSHKPTGAIDAVELDGETVCVLTHSGVGVQNLHDATPTRSTRVVDPLSGSAKSEWRPPTYEKKKKRVTSVERAKSTSSSPRACVRGASMSPTPRRHADTMDTDYSSEFYLTDEEAERPTDTWRPTTREELEEKMWDSAITNAIDKLIGVIDLSASSINRGTITHIPPSVADLEGFTVLPPANSSSTAPSSPILSPTILPPMPSSRLLTRATTLAAPVFDAPFFRSKDGERLRSTPAARAASMQVVSQSSRTQPRRREIQMYLANNSISRLPPELLRVNALTVLSLRSNALTFIPPQIAQLTALKELNLSHNRLRWLPAEMLDMHLSELTVSGNPWITAPPLLPEDRDIRRPVSETVVHFTIPPLSETCSRVLVTPYKPAHVQPSSTSSLPPYLTVLEASYVLPLTDDLHYSPALLATLCACVPAAVSRPPGFDNHGHHEPNRAKRTRHDLSMLSAGQAEDADDNSFFAPPRTLGEDAEDAPTGVSLCPSPMHRASDGSWAQERVPVYVRHAEARWTWEDVIAGVRVGVDVGAGRGGVPVRWRGCSRGCLEFLDPPPAPGPANTTQPTGETHESEAVLDLGLGGMGQDLNVREEDNEDMQMDGIQAEVLQFAGGIVDPEDFEEAF